ncbi:MAG: alpha/beta fold hydrolase [Deltaproteobacteria bacterium]|nr:alpha/beta fold hydrolase [Deltaproteobacteria bacterium]
MPPDTSTALFPLGRKFAQIAYSSGADWLTAGRPRDLQPTPYAVVLEDNGARLLRFVGEPGPAGRRPVLLVPSMINRWYVLDLRPRASLVAALLSAGLDVFCLDWGAFGDEDRYLTWDDVIARLVRMARATLRISGNEHLGVLGYCMGATLSSIYAALHPERVAALVNLAGPIDFAQAGALAVQTDARWFDAHAVAAAGNVAPQHMQSGFSALRPTLQWAKWVGLADRFDDDLAVDAFAALETWANDNVAFPAAAYTTYIGELYQRNALVQGRHVVSGRRVDLGAIRCPTLVVTANRDTICPPRAAEALLDCCGAKKKLVVQVAGGHVGAVVGGRAARDLYPRIAAWFTEQAAPD